MDEFQAPSKEEQKILKQNAEAETYREEKSNEIAIETAEKRGIARENSKLEKAKKSFSLSKSRTKGRGRSR